VKLFPFLTLTLLASVQAEDLTTTDGKTYTGVEVTKVDPDGLRIRHEAGTAKIPFEKLPVEIQKQHGYDPFSAYDHEQAVKAKQAAIDQADAAGAAKRKQQAAQLKAADDHKRSLNMAKAWGKMMRMSRHAESTHVADGTAQPGGDPGGNPKTRGITVDLAAGTRGKVPVMKGKLKAGEQDGWIFSKSTTFGYVDDAPVTTATHNGKITMIAGEEILYPIGLARFTDLSGNKKTLPRFTKDLNVAAAFYAKHSLPPAADSVVTDLSATKP